MHDDSLHWQPLEWFFLLSMIIHFIVSLFFIDWIESLQRRELEKKKFSPNWSCNTAFHLVLFSQRTTTKTTINNTNRKLAFHISYENVECCSLNMFTFVGVSFNMRMWNHSVLTKRTENIVMQQPELSSVWIKTYYIFADNWELKNEKEKTKYVEKISRV